MKRVSEVARGIYLRQMKKLAPEVRRNMTDEDCEALKDAAYKKAQQEYEVECDRRVDEMREERNRS